MTPRCILLRVYVREIPVLGVEMLVELGIAVGYVGTLVRGAGVDFIADDSCAAGHFFCLGLVILFGFGGFDLAGNADLARSADLVGNADVAGNADLIVC